MNTPMPEGTSPEVASAGSRTPSKPKVPKGGVLRPPGLVVFALFVALLAMAWWLYADRLVERGVEATGSSIVGARVDLRAADIRPAEGSIRLSGLQVTNPGAPMTNLFEAEEILVDLMLEPLLTRKVVVQNLVVTGVRFNTPRESSGALENPDPASGQLFREIDAWADGLDLPSLDLEGLSTVVRTDAISVDSLRTLQEARALVDRADSLRRGWEARVLALDPRPRIDSLKAVVERLEGFRLTPLTATQVPGLVRDGRAALEGLAAFQDEIASLDDDVRGGIGSLNATVTRLPEFRAADLAYARGLLNLPSLEAPELSPAIFGGTALAWLKPVLYWAQTAERYLPPGLDPRNRPGPSRTRAAGTTVEFPGRATYPSFLLERGEVGLEIGGSGLAAGAYTADLRNLTSQPTLVGRPLELSVGRDQAAQGPQGLTLSAVLDHTTETLRDSLALSLVGVQLPTLELGALDARLALGLGDAAFEFRRLGGAIDARLHWTSRDVRWLRPDDSSTGAQTLAESLAGVSGDSFRIGSAEWAQNFLWRAVSGLRSVELTMGLTGSLEQPTLSVQSNIGSALAESLRRELGREIEAAEARLREEVDRRIQPLVQDARTRVDAIQSQVGTRVADQRAEIEALRTRLEERIEALVPGA